VVTFVSNYHVPVNDYPGGPRFNAQVSAPSVQSQAGFSYIHFDYNYTNIPAINPDAHPISPDFFRNTNWYNVELLTIAGFVVTGIFSVVFLFERRKLAGP
jgi:hypothetical protein